MGGRLEEMVERGCGMELSGGWLKAKGGGGWKWVREGCTEDDGVRGCVGLKAGGREKESRLPPLTLLKFFCAMW